MQNVNENKDENHIMQIQNNSQINTNHVEPLSNENNHNSSWTEGITKFLVEKYSKWMSYVGPMKKLKKKLIYGNNWQLTSMRNLALDLHIYK